MVHDARAEHAGLTGVAMMKPALRIVEVTGPAGAGKTTLSRALCLRDERIVADALPKARRVRDLPFFFANIAPLLPTILSQARCSQSFSCDQIKMMAYLGGWHRALRHRASDHSMIAVLDQGPVFQLAQLRGFGPGHIQARRFERWWARVLEQWTATLDLIIWLDATDAVLLERIRTRNRCHRLKGQSVQEALRFLARYRDSYEDVIAALTVQGGPRLLRFRTDRQTASEIEARVLCALGLSSRPGGATDQISVLPNGRAKPRE